MISEKVIKMFVNSFSPEIWFKLYKKVVCSFPRQPHFLKNKPPMSCNFTLKEEKMPMSRRNLDLIIVYLLKLNKENRKIVDVWTEVASGRPRLCYLK